MSKTSNESKSKYDKKTYKTYIFKVRKDNDLTNKIEAYKENNSLSELIKNLLIDYLK